MFGIAIRRPAPWWIQEDHPIEFDRFKIPGIDDVEHVVFDARHILAIVQFYVVFQVVIIGRIYLNRQYKFII